MKKEGRLKKYFVGFLIFILLAGGAAAYWYFGVYNKDTEPAELTVSDIIESSSRKMLEIQRSVQFMSEEKRKECVENEEYYQHTEFDEFFELISGGYGYFYPVDGDEFKSGYFSQNITKALYVTDFIQKNATATSGFEGGFKTDTLYFDSVMGFKFYATMSNGLVTLYFRDGYNDDHYDQTKIDIRYNSKGNVYEMNISNSAVIDAGQTRILIANVDFLTNKFYGGSIDGLGITADKPTLKWLIDGEYGLNPQQGTSRLFQKIYNYAYFLGSTVRIQTVDMNFSVNNGRYTACTAVCDGYASSFDFSEIQTEWSKVYNECKDYSFKTSYDELDSVEYTAVSTHLKARDYAKNRVYVVQDGRVGRHGFAWLDFDELKSLIELIHPTASVQHPVVPNEYCVDYNSEVDIAKWNEVVEEINNTDPNGYYSMDQFTTFSLGTIWRRYASDGASEYLLDWGADCKAWVGRDVNGNIEFFMYGYE